MVSPSSHPAVQPNEVARWDVQGDGRRVGNLAPDLCHPSPSPVGLSRRETHPPPPPANTAIMGDEPEQWRFYPVDKALW